jgi:tRNA A37 threonylcarbamoyladenosine dehydratase
VKRLNKLLGCEKSTDIVYGVGGIGGVMDETAPRATIRYISLMNHISLSPMECSVNIHITDDTVRNAE